MAKVLINDNLLDTLGQGLLEGAVNGVLQGKHLARRVPPSCVMTSFARLSSMLSRIASAAKPEDHRVHRAEAAQASIATTTSGTMPM